MICDALRAFNLQHVRTVTTPMNSNTDYNGADSEELVDLHRVREALGTLLWIANSTRPYIAYATNFASRHREMPRKCHWKLIKRIFATLRAHRIVVCATGRQVNLFQLKTSRSTFGPMLIGLVIELTENQRAESSLR